jgi:prophage tail gpP-like protein
MSDVVLLVNGRRYGGWKGVTITRSIESIAGSFELEVTDRWSGQDAPWAIVEEDACRVEIDGQVVLDGFVDRRRLSLDGGDRSMSVSGRDRAAALVDCSAILDRWTFRNVNILSLASEIAGRFGVETSLQAGVTLPDRPNKIVINPGDSAFQAIERAAQVAGVIVVSDGAGGIVLTRSGTGRAAPLMLGDNVLSASVEYDFTERFSRYVVSTQAAGTDTASAAATRIRSDARDEEVRRTDRVLMVRPESGVTVADARRLADWEARIRAARSETVNIAVQGWQQPSGALWPINAIANVSAKAIGVDGDMLISQATYALVEGGETTLMRLVRPDAFTPEPRAVVRKSTGAGGSTDWWKNLD